MTHLYLIRHGEYIDIEEERYLEDPGLSSEGVKHTERLRDRLASSGEIKADVLLTSPMRRAEESAKILSPVLGLPVVDEDLREWRSDDGKLSPRDFTARWQQTPAAQRPFFRWAAGCETWLEFSVRVQQALNRLLEAYAGKTLVIVSHGEYIQASFVYFFGLSASAMPGVSLENTSLTHWFTAEPAQRWILERFNDAQHRERNVVA